MRDRAIAIAIPAGLIALAVALKPQLALPVIGAGILLVLAIVLPLEAIVSLVVIASFLSRISVVVLKFHVRPEHVMVILLLLKILLSSRQRLRLSRSGAQAAMAMAVLVGLNVVSTLANSPNISTSFNIVNWIGLDTILLWSLLQVPESMLRKAVLRTGLYCASIMAVAAVALWAVAVAGGPQIGVQGNTASGGFGAYVLSYEANVAAGQLVLWGLIALAYLGSGRGPKRVAKFAAIACPLALIATNTRSAILAYVLAALILGVRGGVLRKRHLVMGAAIILLGVFVLSLGGASSPIHSTEAKLNDFSLASADGTLRTQSWSLAYHDMGNEQLVLGLGTNSYGQRHLDPTRPGLNLPGYLASLPVQVVYDGGALAALALMWLFFSALPRSKYARSVGYAMTAAYVVISMATSPFWFSFTWIFVALGVHQRDRLGTGGDRNRSSEKSETLRNVDLQSSRA